MFKRPKVAYQEVSQNNKLSWADDNEHSGDTPLRTNIFSQSIAQCFSPFRVIFSIRGLKTFQSQKKARQRKRKTGIMQDNLLSGSFFSYARVGIVSFILIKK